MYLRHSLLLADDGDVFSFGASMYELFAFELPWQRGADGRAAMSHGMTAPPPLRNYYRKIHPVLEEAKGLLLELIKARPTRTGG